MRRIWVALVALSACVEAQTNDLPGPDRPTLGVLWQAPRDWDGWLDDGAGALQRFALREGDHVYLTEPEDSPQVLGLRPGPLEVTDQACIDGLLQRPLPPFASARGLEVIDGELRGLDAEQVSQRLKGVFLRIAPHRCDIGCAEIRSGVLQCSEPCPALIEPEAPTPPTPPTPPNPCGGPEPCAPFAAEPACPAGTAKMVGEFDCRPVGTPCGSDLSAWPVVGPEAIFVDGAGNTAGIPVGRARLDLQGALDELTTGVVAVRGRFDPSDRVVVGEGREITIIGLCPAAVVLPQLQVLGRAELRDVSIASSQGEGLSVEGAARLSGVHLIGPGGGIRGGVRAELVLRDVFLDGVDFGIASEGRVDLERIAVRARAIGISVGRAQLTLRQARLEGLPKFTTGGVLVSASTATVTQMAIDGSQGDALAIFDGSTAIVEDLWTNRTDQTAVGVRETAAQLRRVAVNNAGTRGLVIYRPRALAVEDFSLDQGPGTPNDSDAFVIAAEDGETIPAFALRRFRIRGDRFGNVVALWPAQVGSSAAEGCPPGRGCNLVEDFDIQGSVENNRDSVAMQAGISDTVYRRIRLREWRDAGFSMGPFAYADIQDWSHDSSVRTDFGFRLNHAGLQARLRRVQLRGVVVGFEIAAGDIAIADLRVSDAVTALQRGIGLQDTDLEVERFDLRTQSGTLAVQELLNIGSYEIRDGQLSSEGSEPVLGAECTNPYRGLDRVRLLTP